MKRSKAEEDLGELGRAEAVESGNVLPGTKPDPLADYRSAIVDVSSSIEKINTLKAIHAELEGQLARAEVDHEAALQRASEADDLGAAEADERLRIADRLHAAIFGRTRGGQR